MTSSIGITHHKTSPFLRRSALGAALGIALLAVAACGGGGGGDGSGEAIALSSDASVAPQSRVQAQRFLNQATFGASENDIATVTAQGYKGWLEYQFVQPQASHRAYWDAANAATRSSTGGTAGSREVFDSFYMNAVRGPDPLRQRVAFALSEIFVISMVDGNVGGNPRGVASYLDMLGANAFGNYRDLLQAVALHPMMGLYLTWMKNQKEDPAKGRVPDQNFARESMQLFSIGLLQLNPDGTVKTDASTGKGLETYSTSDVEGLSKVLTGYSWSGPDTSDSRFFGGGSPVDPNRDWTPMQPYGKYHSTSAKTFLGQTVAAGGSAESDLAAALDALYKHPNVGPFIGKQLIQKLVTSNPSPAYVARVAQAFNDNGSGVRGDMKAVLRAVLLDREARDEGMASSDGFGKVREPVLRMTAFLRAFGATSDSGRYLIGTTDDPGTQLGQSPMRSPSVFNFFRPGYMAAETKTSAAGLVAPELQLAHETSVAGYANFMRSGVQSGFGQNGLDYKASRRDVQADYSGALAVADDSAQLVSYVADRLLPGANEDLKTEIRTAVDSITIPALKADSSNLTSVTNARNNRVWIAVYLALVSPEFIVQK